MVLDHARKALVGGIDRWPFWHRPGEQGAVVLETKVIVQMTGKVFLDAVQALGLLRASFLGLPFWLAAGLGSSGKVALGPVLAQRTRCSGRTASHEQTPVQNQMVCDSVVAAFRNLIVIAMASRCAFPNVKALLRWKS